MVALKQVSTTNASNLLREKNPKTKLWDGIGMRFLNHAEFEDFSFEMRVDLGVDLVQ